jgi:hypothetical protein
VQCCVEIVCPCQASEERARNQQSRHTMLRSQICLQKEVQAFLCSRADAERFGYFRSLLVAAMTACDSWSRFAERLSVSGRRSTAAQKHQNFAIGVNSALIDSWVPFLVVRFRLRRDVDELPRGDDQDV